MRKESSSWKRSLYVISFGVFVAQISFTITTPFLPMFLSEVGLTTNVSMWSGLIFSVTFITSGIMAPIWGSLSDRHGRKIMLLRSALGIATTTALIGLAQNHIQILILRALNGVLAGYIPASIILTAALTPNNQMSYALSIVQTASAVGVITGPMIGGILAPLIGMRSTFLFAASILVICAFLPYIFNIEDGEHIQKRTSIRKEIVEVMYNKSLLPLFVAWMLVQACIMGVQPTLPLLMEKMVEDNPEMYTGIVFSVLGISTAIGAPIVSRIKRVDLLTIFQFGLISGILLTAAQGLTSIPTTLIMFRFLFGFSNAAITVSGNVLIAQNSAKGSRGSSFGLLNTASAIGQFSGPLLGGFVGEKFGLTSSFFGNAALLGIAFMIILFANKNIRTIPKHGQEV
jgi:DHA1 family multidrug resistance protein-like MFS transporter